MSTSTASFRPIDGVDASYAGENQRRYPRYTLSLPGRFMRSDKLDYPCRLIDISVESAALTTPVPLHVGEKLIVYLSHLGGLEGHVLRMFDGGFAMAICGTQRKRDKLAAQIPRLAAQAEIPEGEARVFPRVDPDEDALLLMPDGAAVACRIHNISLSGAALLTPARPELGSMVVLNKRRGTVVRHYERGIAIEFLIDREGRSDPFTDHPLADDQR